MIATQIVLDSYTSALEFQSSQCMRLMHLMALDGT